MEVDVVQVQQRLGIVGRSPKLIQAINAAVLAAKYDINVLITGENGVGKEVFHKIIHTYSQRNNKKCLAINCGALPEGTINSELFGHVKGAFTGATTDRKGYFEEADGGTLFLDEVGELPMETQARLLRVLQNGEYIRMGSNEVKRTNVRIVAATNKNLEKAIQADKFREDLYYRLATVRIHVPALRERPEDIELLFRKFAGDVADRYKMPAISYDESGRRALLACQWPGNVRQLESVVLQLSVLRKERVMTADILRDYLPCTESGITLTNDKDTHANEFAPGEKEMVFGILFDMRRQIQELQQKLGIDPNAPMQQGNLPVIHGNGWTRSHAASTEEFVEQEAEEIKDPEPRLPLTRREREKQDFIEALKRNGNNKRKTAEELGISERTVHRKIQEYGI